MNIHDVIDIKKGSESIVKIMKGSTLIWPLNSAPLTNYLKKLYGSNNGTSVYGSQFGYNTAINNGVIAVVDPNCWNDNPTPGHFSEIYLYDTLGNPIRTIYTDWDTGDRNNELGHYSLTMNNTHIGAGHNYGNDQYFLWDINGTLIQKIERPVDFTGTAFAGTAGMTSTRLFVGAYNYDVTAGVYVYDMTATYLHKITNPDASAGFGGSIYTNDNYLMISSASGVHIYNSSTYAFIRTITAPEATTGTFGFSCSQNGNYFYISDSESTQGGLSGAGAVWIFNVSDGSMLTKITDASPTQNGSFGYSIDTDGTYLVVGQTDKNTPTSEGWIHIYTATGTFITEQIPDDHVANNQTFTFHGWSVAIENGTIISGAWNDTDGDPDDLSNTQWAGAAYIWDATTF